MLEVKADSDLAAYCGLYCGACGSYLKERCPGCHKNEKASWCKVRACCIENNIATCADCPDFSDPNDCRKYNNIISKVVGFVLRSNRSACIRQIKEIGVEGHAKKMAELKCSTIRK
jgi:hypothetical protein